MHARLLTCNDNEYMLAYYFATETYIRCPSNVDSYNYHCYVILDDQLSRNHTHQQCLPFHSYPVWFSDDAEIGWLSSVLAAHSIDCIHIGNVDNIPITSLQHFSDA